MMKSYFYPIKFLLVVVCCPNADLRSPILLIAPVLQVGLSGPCLVFNDTNIDLIECFDSRTIYDRILLNSRKNIIHHGLNPLNDHISLSITCFNGSEKCLLLFIDNYTKKFRNSVNITLMPINVDSVSIISTRSIIFDDRTFAIDLIYVYSFITDDRKNQSQFLRNRLLIGEHFDVKNSTILSRVEDLSSNLPTNVFSFIYADYAYFLRVKNGKLRYENKRSIFLERICLNDVKNSEFRSFISSFLFETRNCSDKSIIANYDYQTKTLQIFFNGGKEFHYSLIEYTLANVHARINDMFYDCYNSSNAFDIAILTPSPKMCRIYRMYEDRYKPCGVDLCSPTSCALTGRFHIESYRKISFDRRFSLISSTPINRQTSCDEVEKIFNVGEDILLFKRRNMYKSYLTAVLLSVNPPRIFHSSVINADVDDSAISFINDTLIVGSKNKIEYIALNCSFIDSCPDSMSLRNLSLFANCGWCYNSFGKSFSSSREQCLLDDKNVFLNDVCPPETDCFENDYINVNSSTEIHFRGFFPNVISMNATVCGIPCQLISSNESRLSCHIESHNPNEINPANLHCSIELEVMFRNKIFKANPKCSKKLLVQRLPIIEQVMQNDEILRKKNNNLVVFLTISTLLLIFAFACIAYRRISIRKKANDSNSHWYNTLPLRPFEFISHRMNSYVAEPGADTYCSIERSEGIYDDLSYLVPDNVRIPWNSITKEEMIGMGHFGEVYRGIYTKPNGRVFTVAIKTLRIGARNVKQFVDEGIRMELFDHKNVLSLVGITFNESNYPLIVTPFMAHGDLLSYLRNPNNSPTVRNLLEFGIDIIEGLKYLHQMRYVHRDLAARNCMLDENLCVKVADFGLSRDVYESEFYLSVNINADIPIRWLPPESIERQEYSAKSDVWSYGVTLWELMTRGLTPYSHLTGYRLLDYVKSGQRLPLPKMCPVEIFELMKMCWYPRPNDRPDSGEVLVRLKVIIKMLESDAPSYYNMQTCLESMSQYEVPCSLNDAGRQEQ